MPSYRTRSSTCSTPDRASTERLPQRGSPRWLLRSGGCRTRCCSCSTTLSPQQGQRCWTASTGSPVSPCSSRNSISWPGTAGVVDLLPQVDTLLRQLLSVPTTRHLQALQDAVAQYGARYTARAQVFRLLLYLVALALLGVLLLFFLRLQAQAQALRQRRTFPRPDGDRQRSDHLRRSDLDHGVLECGCNPDVWVRSPEALGMSLLLLLPAPCRTTLTTWLEQGTPRTSSGPPRVAWATQRRQRISAGYLPVDLDDSARHLRDGYAPGSHRPQAPGRADAAARAATDPGQ